MDRGIVRQLLRQSFPYVALLAASYALYAGTVGFEFIPTWDDGVLVIRNPHIRGLTAPHLLAMFTKPAAVAYDPVHMVSFALDYALWGLNPAGYHLTNVLLHGVNACLLYAVVRTISGSVPTAFISAMLFAVHPLNVENVAWVSERKTVLSTFFLFLSLRCYLAWRARDAASRYLGSLMFFVLAVLSKPTVVILPLILLAYEAVLRRDGSAWRRLTAFFAVAAAGAIITIWAYRQGGIIGGHTFTVEMLLGTVYPTMFPIYWKYLSMVVWPANLSGFYDARLYYSFLDPVVLLSTTGTVLAIGIVLWKGNAQVRFWCLWTVLSFLPFSGIIPQETVYYADRYMYVPAIGLFVLFSMGLVRLHAAAARTARLPRQAGAAVLLGAACMVAGYAYVAHTRTFVWQDEMAFWTDTAGKSPDMYKPHLNLGVAYEKRGMYREAEAEYLRAIAIYPEWIAVENLKMLRARMSSGGR